MSGFDEVLGATYISGVVFERAADDGGENGHGVCDGLDALFLVAQASLQET